MKLEIDTNTALLAELVFNTISPRPIKLIREDVEPAVKTVRFELLIASMFKVEAFDMKLNCEYPYIPVLIAVAGVSKKRVRVKGSPVIFTPFRPTRVIVGETIEFENALILFPPLISNVSKHLEYKLATFVTGSTREPIPLKDDMANVLNGLVAVIFVLSTTTRFMAGVPPRVAGMAQYVPPLPSDVRVVNAGINEFVGVRAFTLRIVIESVSIVFGMPF